MITPTPTPAPTEMVGDPLVIVSPSPWPIEMVGDPVVVTNPDQLAFTGATDAGLAFLAVALVVAGIWLVRWVRAR